MIVSCIDFAFICSLEMIEYRGEKQEKKAIVSEIIINHIWSEQYE